MGDTFSSPETVPDTNGTVEDLMNALARNLVYDGSEALDKLRFVRLSFKFRPLPGDEKEALPGLRAANSPGRVFSCAKIYPILRAAAAAAFDKS